MSDVNSILNQRMKKPNQSSKMAVMAKRSVNGNLTSFSGVFSIEELSVKEKENLREILQNYAIDEQDINQDLDSLITITSEVKAINNQAALLHGERIKKAHVILTQYKEGAFTAWLLAAYGNRQTPYNLMQYYEFCEMMPKPLRQKIELMPRQAVYVLASREGSIEQKQNIIKNYQGETKAEMLTLIRQMFPLKESDKRKIKMGQTSIQSLKKVHFEIQQSPKELTSFEKQQIIAILKQIQLLLKNHD